MSREIRSGSALTTSTDINLKRCFEGRNFIKFVFKAPADALPKMLAEARGLDSHFTNHSHGDLNDWTALCLHGLGAHKTENANHYGFSGDLDPAARAHMGWTEVASLAPEIVAFIKALPFDEFYRVRILRMGPGGYVGWHGDEGWHGSEETVDHYVLNMAINSPAAAALVFGDGEAVRLAPGEMGMINFNRWHCATNPSEEVRYHLKIHGRIRPEFTQYVHESLKTESYNEKPRKVKWGLWGDASLDQWIAKKCAQLSLVSVSSRDVLVGSSVDEILRKCDDAELCILLKCGNYVENARAIESEVQRLAPSVMGHLLNYANHYPFLHDQFLVIDVGHWRSIGSPSLLQLGKSENLADFEASAETVHDDYTPKFLEPKPGTMPGDRRFGSELLSVHLTKGLNVNNVPENIRSQKLYLYPHRGSGEVLKSSWQSNRLMSGLDENHLRFLQTYYREGQREAAYWPYNSESIEDVLEIKWPLQTPPEYLIGPAGGLKLEFLAHRLGCAQGSTLVFADVSRTQLAFKEHLFNSWKGGSYQKFVAEFISRFNIPDSARFHNYSYKDLTILPWYNETKIFESISRLRQSLKDIRFENVDLLNPDGFERALPQGESAVLWLSNIMHYVYTHMKFDLPQIFLAQGRLEREMIGRYKSYRILGDRLSPDVLERYYQLTTPRSKLGAVKVFLQNLLT